LLSLMCMGGRARCPTRGRDVPGQRAGAGRARGPGSASRPPGPSRAGSGASAARCGAPCHGPRRCAPVVPDTGQHAVVVSTRRLWPRGLARRAARRTPRRATSGGEAQGACHPGERFPTEETAADCGRLPCRKPLGFLPPLVAPLSSRSARSWRGDRYGHRLWMPIDTSSESLYPMRCPMKLYTKPHP